MSFSTPVTGSVIWSGSPSFITSLGTSVTFFGNSMAYDFPFSLLAVFLSGTLSIALRDSLLAFTQVSFILYSAWRAGSIGYYFFSTCFYLTCLVD